MKFTKQVNNNSAYVDLIREKYNLPKKSNIKCKTTIEKILKQIEIEDIKNAIKNAEEIMKNKLKEDQINVRNRFYYYNNPSMNINEFFRELFKECGMLEELNKINI